MSSFVPGGLKVTLMPDMAIVGRNARGYRGMSFTDAKGQNYVIWRYRVVSNAAGSHQMLAVVGPYTGGYTEDLSVGTDQYTLKENEYLLQATIKNDCATDQVESFPAFFSRTSGTSGNFDWLSFDTNTSDAQRYIEFEFSKDKPAPMISCTLGVYPPNGTAGKRTNEFLQLRGRQVSFTNGTMSGSTMMITVSSDSPSYKDFLMDISHLDETSGITYKTLSATGKEAQKSDVEAGVKESKDYTDEKLNELLDSLYPPVDGTTTLTVYASGNKTLWHFNSLEIYLASGQRLYPLYYENVNTGGGVNQIKLIFTKDPNASLTLQNTAFFDTYELKDGEYSGALLTAESFGQTTTQSNNASSNIFSTDNYGLYVVPTASESAAFGIEITGELQQIAKISLRSPRQSSYVPPKIRATLVFDDTTLEAPEVETNSDISATFVFPFAEKSESEDIDLSNYVTLDGAESITGVKTFAATPVITNAPAGDTDAVNKAYVDQAIQDAALEGEEIDTSKLVTTDTAQSITGAKTFTAPVTVGAPTAGTHAATKDYVDQALETALEEGGAAGDLSNFVTLDGAQTITGLKTFSILPQSDKSPSNEKDLITKKYVDDIFTESGIFNTKKQATLQKYSFDLTISPASGKTSNVSGLSNIIITSESGELYLKKCPSAFVLNEDRSGNSAFFVFSLEKPENFAIDDSLNASIELGPSDFLVLFETHADVTGNNLRSTISGVPSDLFKESSLLSGVTITNGNNSNTSSTLVFSLTFYNTPLISSISLHRYNNSGVASGFYGLTSSTLGIQREFNEKSGDFTVAAKVSKGLIYSDKPKLPIVLNFPLELTEKEKEAFDSDVSDTLTIQTVVDLAHNQDIDGIKTFTTLPQSSVTPTLDSELVTKKYVDAAIAALKAELSGS